MSQSAVAEAVDYRGIGRGLRARVDDRRGSPRRRPDLLPLPTPKPARNESSAPLDGLLLWLSQHLREQHTVTALARRAHMSERTLARKFQAVTGTTPYRWLIQQRVQLAQRLLEETDLTVEQIADRVGFNSTVVLRAHLRRQTGVAPSAYRQQFGRPSDQTA